MRLGGQEMDTAHNGDIQQSDAVARETPLLLSMPEAARLLGVGMTLCRDIIQSKQLPTVRLGRRVLVPRAAVERLAGVYEGQGSMLDSLESEANTFLHASEAS